MPGVVIENPALDGARAVVAPEALHDWTLRGWEAKGPHAEGADGILTQSEWTAEVARREAQVKAAMAPATTPTRTAQKGGAAE